MNDLQRALDNWCYDNADCNLIAWKNCTYRDPILMSNFIDLACELIIKQKETL